MVERKKLIVKMEDDSPPTRKAGRPSSYDPRFAKIARQMCARGATDSDLADAFDVSTVTIHFWQSQFPEFQAAVREGKAEIFDPKIERAMAQRALGYSVDVEEVKVSKDGEVIRYTVRKHYPPDPTCCIFWLKNRQPEKWRDVWRIDQNLKIEEKLTSEELLEEIRKEAIAIGLMPEQALKLIKGVAPPTTNGKGNGSKLN